MGVLMGFRILLFSLLVSRFPLVLGDDVKVTVKGVTSIGTIDDNFICATLDWWPEAKCYYGQCPWGKSGIMNLNLNNPILSNAIKAFKALRIRIGGSMQDQVLYKVGKTVKTCNNLENSTTGFFGFADGCLTMERWDQINALMAETGALVTFGINALYGRKKLTAYGLYDGHWDSMNARDFVNYTIFKGYKIDSWELGHELCGSGISARVDARQYGEDVIRLKKLLNKLYRRFKIQPKLLGPAGFYDEKWFSSFLQKSGPNVIDVVTHHIYNLGSGVNPNLIHYIRDPLFLDKVAQTYKDLETTLQRFGPWASAWVGESGGAYNSGGKTVSHTFVNSFWYLDQLGMASAFNHKVFCLQTLVGGNYGLLNTTTMVPNPDYYSALLWHRLMGKSVLSTTHNGSPYLRAYSHCSKMKPGITILLINMSNSTAFNVSVESDVNLYPLAQPEGVRPREEYHLTPKGGCIQSEVMLLNGFPLVLTERLDIPPMKPFLVDGSLPIKVAPDSIVFATIRDFKAPACAWA
ncbi:heparanase-like protein 1 [Papaver somniferum]|uniref:heparanase-like protein 1 n=1 Tax=Papaver somniferum TaxID=3469 RepID=UPI000E6F5CF8|nr:heparanase-like protein 1 [Papaver somniferum]